MVPVDKFGCFGKLSLSREFLVERASDLTKCGFDSWVSEGMALARSPLGSAYKERALGFPPYRFVWSGHARRSASLVGHLTPGADAAGRLHPFSVFAVLDSEAMRSDEPAQALRLAGLHAMLEDAAGRARTCTEPAALTSLVRSLRCDLAPDTSYETAEYRSFLETRTNGELWTGVLGDAAAPGRYQILQALFETVEYLRGRAATDVHMGVRFPLPAGPAVMEIAFWLDLTTRIFRGSIDGCCYLWNAGAGETPATGTSLSAGVPGASVSTESAGLAGSPHLLFFFSPPTTAQFVALIDPASDVESISYLERPYGGPPEDRMAPALRSVLDEPNAPLRAILDWAASA
ncbi:MAG: type VI secretion system-associated protein TagF [Candidatus Eisenbacteria bacterium]